MFAAGSTASGIGTFENVDFNGTYYPGNSPVITKLGVAANLIGHHDDHHGRAGARHLFMALAGLACGGFSMWRRCNQTSSTRPGA